MVSTDDVKRALSALATRTDTATRPYTAVIDEADAAREDLHRAAGFVEAVGLDRLEDAIADAERDGNVELADRGRATLDSYRRFRAVANETSPTDGPQPRVSSEPPDRRQPPDAFESARNP